MPEPRPMKHIHIYRPPGPIKMERRSEEFKALKHYLDRCPDTFIIQDNGKILLEDPPTKSNGALNFVFLSPSDISASKKGKLMLPEGFPARYVYLDMEVAKGAGGYELMELRGNPLTLVPLS